MSSHAPRLEKGYRAAPYEPGDDERDRLADEAATERATRVLRLATARFRTLEGQLPEGDAQALRIIRTVANGDATVAEFAQRIGITIEALWQRMSLARKRFAREIRALDVTDEEQRCLEGLLRTLRVRRDIAPPGRG